ncbi:MAG: NUDIX domain-containing protein, partial [Candidatus Woesebacteria bacterium]|nr:NUDIX domain-containing protein [Candidatus Woesebacteria bacterium]
LEMPGGGLEKEETPQEGMERELLKEIGYKGDVEFIASVYDDAYSNRIRHCFVIKNSKKVQEPMPEADEGDIEIVEISLADFREHLKSGQLTDIEVGYLVLDHLKLL